MGGVCPIGKPAAHAAGEGTLLSDPIEQTLCALFEVEPRVLVFAVAGDRGNALDEVGDALRPVFYT